MGVNGACRSMELCNIKNSDVEYHDEIILVKVRETKTKIDRSFVIHKESAHIVRKYHDLRPENMKSDNFFINYRNGTCLRQNIGRHKIAAMPKQIAEYLNLPNPESYTGHCFRRSSATLLADSEANLTTIKRHEGWKSDRVAEGYIEESLENKSEITSNINKKIKLNTQNTPSSTSPQPSTSRQQQLSLTPQPPTSRHEPTTIPLPVTSSQPSTVPNNPINVSQTFTASQESVNQDGQ
jgi:integrase